LIIDNSEIAGFSQLHKCPEESNWWDHDS